MKMKITFRFIEYACFGIYHVIYFKTISKSSLLMIKLICLIKKQKKEKKNPKRTLSQFNSN